MNKISSNIEYKLTQNKTDIKNWLDKYNIKNYTINDGLSVDVDGDVNISYQNLKVIPVKFRNVLGSFWCNSNKLTSFVGSPKSVGGSFYCVNNQLVNLTGSPKTVGGHFNCNGNRLISLVGSPRSIYGSFWCDNNKLTNLTGAPEYVHFNFWCNGNKLTSLTSSPKYVGGDFVCVRNKLKNLAGAPKTVNGSFRCEGNSLTSLLEIIECNCNFKGSFYFNIDKNNFQQKELIEMLKRYCNPNGYYQLTFSEFHDKIKPQIEKKILQLHSLKLKLKNKTKTANNFL